MVIANLSPDKGGPPKAATEMCEELAKKGHEVTLCTTNFRSDGKVNIFVNQPLQENGYTTFYFAINKLNVWSFSFELGRYIKRI